MITKDQGVLNQLLKDIVVLIVGKSAENIVDLLDSDKHINEFIIAKKLGVTINQTRNILYKISDQGLVSFVRKKDKRKGWYTYFWKLEILKALEYLKGVLLNKIEQMNNQINSRELKQFYVCELCNVEFNEENALLKDFTCSECGNVFVLKDNAPIIKELRKNISRFEKDLELVEKEIVKEKEKIDKGNVKEAKKQDKIKKAAKEVLSKERKNLYAKMKKVKKVDKKISSKKKITKIKGKKVKIQKPAKKDLKKSKKKR
jgi:transcription factor E